SDNGWMWGEHGLSAKTKPYSASVQIPMLLRWPGEVARGEEVRGFAANIDMAPTVVEAVGLTPEVPMDGKSLLGGSARSRVRLEGAFLHGNQAHAGKGCRGPHPLLREVDKRLCQPHGMARGRRYGACNSSRSTFGRDAAGLRPRDRWSPGRALRQVGPLGLEG